MSQFLPQETIRRKRDGASIEQSEISAFVRGISDGSVSEGQIAAFAMAIYFKKFGLDERIAMTLAMRDSGTVLDWSALPGPALDKHSTGGIGDTVSLLLAPAVAACGGYVPMISGRGLGHTGGTLDKLDAIPGYRSTPQLDEIRRVVRSVGCAIIGQTNDLAPADRRLYAIRDVTATVETLDLITPSILSKKLAAGLGGLVLDVKVGSGAFLPSLEAARELAESLVAVAGGAGLPTVALITDMDAPLASAAGNAIETRLAVDVLAGRAVEPRLVEVTVELGAEMLVLGDIAPDVATGRERIAAALVGGRAAEVFQEMVSALGGPDDLVEHPGKHLAHAPIVRPVSPTETGTVGRVDTRALGLAVIGLGGGRRRPDDVIDPAVGLAGLASPGDTVGPHQPLAVVHARTEAAADAAAAAVLAAYHLGETHRPHPLIVERIG